MNGSFSKGERTSQAIIAAAYELFLEQGFHATSMRQIAQRAGLALGGIYNHFDSKEQIFATVLIENHPYRRLLQILESTPGETLVSFAQNAARLMIEEMESRPDFLKLIFIELIEFQSAHIPHLIQTIFPQLYPLLQRFRDQQDELRDLPLPVIMLSFMGTFFSYYVITHIVTPGSGLNLGNDTLELYMDIFLHGIIVPQSAQLPDINNPP
jgi:AcrR family transcriptional regulator